jgi:hypothetical protein
VKPSIQIDTTALTAAFTEYASLSKRSLAENLNQKGYSICLSAFGMTKKATPADIRKYLAGVSETSKSLSVAEMLVNTKRRREGKPWLTGGELKTAAREFIAKKSKHTNYLRSGWFGAIGEYAAKIGKVTGKSIARALNKFGKNGGATMAKPSISTLTTFWNTAFSKFTTTNQGEKIASVGLLEAMNKQTADMRVYIARKRQQEADRIFRRFLR